MRHLWSESCGEYLRRKLANALRAIADYYRALPDAARELETLKRLSRFSPTDEDAQLLYLNALRGCGKGNEIVRHGEWLCETLQQDYGSGLPDAVEKALNERPE